VDPKNKGNLSYDEFFKNITKHVKLTNPETYVLFKECKDSNDSMSMKKFFRLMGGS